VDHVKVEPVNPSAAEPHTLDRWISTPTHTCRDRNVTHPLCSRVHRIHRNNQLRHRSAARLGYNVQRRDIGTHCYDRSVFHHLHPPRQHSSLTIITYQVRRKKTNPLKLFPVFSATAWNFCMKFYSFMRRSYLHLNAEQHSVIIKYNEVIDILA